MSNLLKCNNVNVESDHFLYSNISSSEDSSESDNITKEKDAISEPSDPESLMVANKKAAEIIEADNKARTAEKEKTDRISEAEAKILAEADREAKQIIDSAKSYISKMRSFAQKKAELDYEEAKTDGFKTGYEAGKEVAIRENDGNVNELKQLIKDFEEQKSKYISDSKKELLNVAFKIAEKIIGEKLDRNDSTFISIFKNTVKDLTAQKWIRLSVSEYDYKFATANSDTLMKLVSGAESIEIMVLEKAPKGTCIVETSEKILDASVGTQLESLYNAVINS